MQFTQLIDGILVIGPGEGKVSVSLDNDQNVISIVDRSRTVAKLVDAASAPPPPAETPREGMAPPSPASDLPEQLLSAAWQDRMKLWAVRGRMPERYAAVPGSFEVGYVIRGNSAVLVARQEVEADCGGGFLKRFVVEAPIQ